VERSLSTTLRRRPAQVAALVVLALAASLLLAACGDTVGYTKASSGDRIHGKELFKQGCGSCHTLADAGTTGTIGPNLDYAFLQSRKDGLGEDTILQVVRDQMAYAITTPSTGVPGMPRDLAEITRLFMAKRPEHRPTSRTAALRLWSLLIPTPVPAPAPLVPAPAWRS